jgi:outer membrane protein assembly factor BamB/TolA-binding protein
MATLEIHDGQGRVRFIELAQDHPVLFGTSAACDVVLEGEEILPVHGRIRWSTNKFKVEASPDAEYVVINGHKMTSGGLQQGDEIAVGSSRLFLLRSDEPGTKARSRRGSGPEEERTNVLPGSAAARDRAEGTAKRKKSRPSEEEDNPFETSDWVSSLREKPAAGSSGSAAAPLSRRWGRDPVEEAVVAAPPAPAAKKGFLGGFGRFLTGWGAVAPGRERIATSPLVIGLVATFAILVGLGFWLKSTISATVATRTYNHGVQMYEDGDYRTAMRDLDTFVTANPDDSRVGKARVLRAYANVRQYVSSDGTTWSSALEAAKEMTDQVGKLPEFRDEKADLGELIIKVGEGLADRARQATDPKSLAEAEDSVALHARIVGEQATAFMNKSRLPGKLGEARAAVKKAQIRAEALAKMDAALKEGSATHVYDARDLLVEQYADLARDKDLVSRMTAANELIRKAVKVDQTRRAAVKTPRPDPLGPPTSMVLRSRQDAPTLSLPVESIVYAHSDGFAYALDGTNGAPLWHIPLGVATPFAPQAVPGDATVLAFDSRFNELIRLDARTGALKWRLALEEPVADPPLLLGNQLAQILPSGKLLLIGLESGELDTTVTLGRPLARSPVSDDSGQHLYVLGRQDCVFILARDPLSCIGVIYLGHMDGSIPCPPARLGRFLVILENESLYDSKMRILVLDDEGAKARPVQELKVSGWTWQTPANSGPIVWGTGDKGGYEAFSAGDDTSKTPFRSVARLTADATPSGPAYAVARSDRELWVASGHAGRYELDVERGTIVEKASLGQPGPAQAPIQTAGKLIVLTFQDQENRGSALWGIEPEAGVIVWKTVVGVPWPTSVTAATGDGGLELIAKDGREIRISQDQLARGGFLVQVLGKPGDFALPSGHRLVFQAGGKTLSAVVPEDPSNFFWAQDPDKAGSWKKIVVPVAMAARPIVWEGGILIPGRDARAYLIDPITAQARAEPFVPKFDRDHQGNWHAPAVLDREMVVLADDVGRVHRVALKPTPVPRLVGEAQVTLPQKIVADPACTSEAVIVVTGDSKVRSLAIRDLSPIGTWTLEAPLAGPPIGSSDACFVLDRAGGVLALGRDGKRMWSINLKSEVVGSPSIHDKTVLFLTKDGTLHARGSADGAEQFRRPLGFLPSGGLLMAGTRALAAAAAGTVRPLIDALVTANKP